MNATAHDRSDYHDTWAELNGRWFFAWRMALACEEALREVDMSMGRSREANRAEALRNIRHLLQKEMRQWVRRGEALDMIVQHLPRTA